MRLYLSIIAATALTATACGKKAEKPPEAKQEQVSKPEEKKPEEKKPEEKKPEEAAKPEDKKGEEVAKPEGTKPEEAKPAEAKAAPADRTQAAQDMLAAMSAGNVADAFKFFADDATCTDVGMPNGEVKGVQAMIEYHKKAMTGMTEVAAKAARIIEAGEYQVVEYVMTGKNTGALADGTAATNKTVALPAAMLMHFNAAGLVDKAWMFSDMVSMAQQLGLMPGLAADFVAAKLPETTEIVKGDFNPALKDLYMAFGAKMKPDTIEAAIDEMLTDDYTMYDDMTGKTVTGKAAMKESMKKWMSMFAMDSMTADIVAGAGDYLVVVGTSAMTYKGGIDGIEPKDQKLTGHSLEISKFENGKFKSYTSYANHMETMGALMAPAGAAEKPAEGEAAKAGELPTFDVATCNVYLKGMTACIEKMPEAGRDAYKQALKASVDSFNQVAAMGAEAKTALEQACKAALDAVKQAGGAMCPDVKWE